MNRFIISQATRSLRASKAPFTFTRQLSSQSTNLKSQKFTLTHKLLVASLGLGLSSTIYNDTKEESAQKSEPATEEKEPTAEDYEGAAYNPVTGEINWDCPCLGGMAHGPCGEEFKEAFACFVYSESEPKGIDCIKKFEAMRTCFRRYPEHYKEQLMDDEELEASRNETEVVVEPVSTPSESATEAVPSAVEGTPITTTPVEINPVEVQTETADAAATSQPVHETDAADPSADSKTL